MYNRIYVWDWPLRLFHWLLVVSLIAAYLTQEFDLMQWHQRVGLAILGLVVFRLTWGFVGTRHARFAEFLRGPSGVRAYLRGEWRGHGHNPLGGWSVLLLLLLPLGMTASGLFANDDVAFKGLLADWLDKSASDQATRVHHLAFNVLLGLVALHLAAITFYRVKHRHDLIKPMLTGWKETETTLAPTLHESTSGQVKPAGGVLAFTFALALAAATVTTVAMLEPPPPTPAPSTSSPEW